MNRVKNNDARNLKLTRVQKQRVRRCNKGTRENQVTKARRQSRTNWGSQEVHEKAPEQEVNQAQVERTQVGDRKECTRRPQKPERGSQRMHEKAPEWTDKQISEVHKVTNQKYTTRVNTRKEHSRTVTSQWHKRAQKNTLHKEDRNA